MKNISEHSRFRTRLQAIVVVISICITLSSCKKSVENPTPLAPGERGQIAHQIPGRDLSLNPPQTGEVTLSRMDKPTDQVNAILTVKYNERNLPTVLKVILDEKVVTLRDDGKGSDQKAGDGVYTAAVMVDFDSIARNNARVQNSIKGNDRASLIPVFVNRQIVLRAPVTFLTPDQAGIIRFIPPFIFPVNPLVVNNNESLMINDPSVLNDQTPGANGQPRTYDGCSATGSTGNWTFGWLMTQLANKTATGTDPSAFVLNWLNTWLTDQSINGFTAAQRLQINKMISLWQTRSGGPGQPLNLALAPFRLLAIANRLDLRTAGAYGGGTAGEGRLVFGLMDTTTTPCKPVQFNVIFEYGVPIAGCANIKSWAQQWENLSTLALPSAAFNTALETITNQFTAAGANPANPAGSALDQLRIDEKALTLPWELREFHDALSGTGPQVMLQEVVVKQNPDPSLNGSTTLGDYINANVAQIDAGSSNVFQFNSGTNVVPLQFPAGQNFQGAQSINLNRSALSLSGQPTCTSINTPPCDVWGAPNISVTATSNPPLSLTVNPRHFFGLETCNGCHGVETGNQFVMVDNASVPPGALSGFLTGISVVDPAAPSITNTYGDLQRRALDLDQTANQVCIFQLPFRPTILSFPD